MSDVLLGVRVFAIEIAIVGHQFGDGDSPGLIVLFPLAPPFQTGLEFLELERLRRTSGVKSLSLIKFELKHHC